MTRRRSFLNAAYARGLCASLLVSFVSISAVFGEAAHAQSEPIKIGVLTIRSGPASPIGKEILTGIQTAIELQGKIDGRSVELIVEDSLFNPQVAVTKATKLVQRDEVVAILGTSTIEAMSLLSVAGRLGVPIVTSNAGSAVLTGKRCNKWVFRTNPDELMGKVGMRKLITQDPRLQNAKWFGLGHDYPWSRLVTSSVRDVPGVSFLGETFAPLDTTDWAPFIAQARKGGATALVIPVTLGTPLVQFIQQAHEFGLTKEAVMVAPIGLPDWLIEALGELSTSIVSAGSWGAWQYQEQDSTTRKFNEAYFRMHGRAAGMQSLQAGAAAMLLFAAIDNAGTSEPGAVVKALEAIDIDTPVGKLRFQAGGRQAESPLFLGPIKKLPESQYGAKYAQSVTTVVPASESLESAKDRGCKLN